jgi:glycerol uptake facilitator-like aquaporin
MSLGIVFLSELFGTAMLTLLGCGVVANVALKGTKGNSGGFLMVTWGGASPCSRVSLLPPSPVPTSIPPSPWAC